MIIFTNIIYMIVHISYDCDIIDFESVPVRTLNRSVHCVFIMNFVSNNINNYLLLL